ILPHPAEDRTVQSPKEAGFFEVWASYFRQEKIGWVLAFILLFRLGEAMLIKMLVPFLKDIPSSGGLGLSTEQVGLVYGTLGVLGLVVGGIVGGILIARFGLRRCIFPMALCVHIPNLGYLYLAHFQPTGWSVPAVVALEQLGYGFGFTAFMVFLMQTVGDRFKTAHFAISTGFMALGMMLPGMVSGYIQEATGYFTFFVIVCLLTLPGLATIPFLPIRNMIPDGTNKHPA
ncbi:MAG: MFS transporter, partial [Verrucomicrobiota bacterium]|nr:MFS transporter [Verrucomicrobiota bacterium]